MAGVGAISASETSALAGALAAIGQAPEQPEATPPAGWSPQQVADRLLDTLLAGDGPIYIAVTGTGGASYDHAVLSTLQEVARQGSGGAATVVSLPYANGVADIGRRTLGLSGSGRDEALAIVLRELARRAPHRPVYVVAQSQGSWLVSQVLRDDPDAARAVTRAVLFSRPALAPSVDAWVAAGTLLEVNHVDDIVTGVPTALNREMLRSFAASTMDWMRGQRFSYLPHRYEPDAALAARFLLGSSLGLAEAARHHSGMHHRH